MPETTVAAIAEAIIELAKALGEEPETVTGALRSAQVISISDEDDLDCHFAQLGPSAVNRSK